MNEDLKSMTLAELIVDAREAVRWEHDDWLSSYVEEMASRLFEVFPATQGEVDDLVAKRKREAEERRAARRPASPERAISIDWDDDLIKVMDAEVVLPKLLAGTTSWDKKKGDTIHIKRALP